MSDIYFFHVTAFLSCVRWLLYLVLVHVVHSDGTNFEQLLTWKIKTEASSMQRIDFHTYYTVTTHFCADYQVYAWELYNHQWRFHHYGHWENCVDEQTPQTKVLRVCIIFSGCHLYGGGSFASQDSCTARICHNSPLPSGRTLNVINGGAKICCHSDDLPRTLSYTYIIRILTWVRTLLKHSTKYNRRLHKSCNRSLHSTSLYKLAHWPGLSCKSPVTACMYVLLAGWMLGRLGLWGLGVALLLQLHY